MPLLALLIIVAIALVIVRIGAKALMMTGLSRDVAEFQAISCFFGAGFTTNEAEMIMGHSVRRKIASHLIIAGNIGLTGALSTLIITFMQDEPKWVDDLSPFDGSEGFFFKLAVILVGVLVITALFKAPLVKRLLDFLIERSLRRFQIVHAIDYETVLRSDDGYVVMQVEIEPGHGLAGRSLRESRLGSRGVIVLGIRRKGGERIGTPHASAMIEPGDLLTVYGHERVIPAVLDADPTQVRSEPDEPGEPGGPGGPG